MAPSARLRVVTAHSGQEERDRGRGMTRVSLGLSRRWRDLHGNEGVRAMELLISPDVTRIYMDAAFLGGLALIIRLLRKR